jgi:adenylate cyclase
VILSLDGPDQLKSEGFGETLPRGGRMRLAAAVTRQQFERAVMRGGISRNLSLISGLILFAFAATHFLNHAIGLFQLETMDEVQQWRLAVTRSWPGSLVLGAALLTHVVFGLLKTARRGTLRLPAWELVQIVLGLATPLLLLPHIIDTRVAMTAFGVQDSYLYELARLWPAAALTQTALLLVVWIHGCLGIHYWLKFRGGYATLQPILLLLAIALPLAALAGFAVSGRAVAGLISDPAVADRVKAVTHWPDASSDERLAWYRLLARIVFASLLALMAIVIMLRRFGMFAAPKLTIAYAGGPKVQSAIGPTLLEISRANGMAHASACGGRARCGTCRVRIDDGAATLPPPGFAERFTLARVGAPDNARLACQIRPRGSLSVTRLVRLSDEGPPLALAAGTDDAGVHKPLCLLYLRIRDIDGISRDRLPYDVMFILNEFFAASGAAIDQNHGWVDKFLGDGLMAVFGQQRGQELGCRDALLAARAIDTALDRLNEKVAAEIGHPIAASIGLHTDSFLLGRIGLGKISVLSVVGAGTEVPLQLAGAAQEIGWQMALSMEAARRAGVTDLGQPHALAISGSTPRSIDIIGVARARDIAVPEPAPPELKIGA